VIPEHRKPHEHVPFNFISLSINLLPNKQTHATLPLLSIAARLLRSAPSPGVSLPVASVIISLSSPTIPNTSAILSNPSPFVSGIHFAKTIAATSVNPPYIKYGPLAV